MPEAARGREAWRHPEATPPPKQPGTCEAPVSRFRIDQQLSEPVALSCIMETNRGLSGRAERIELEKEVRHDRLAEGTKEHRGPE